MKVEGSTVRSYIGQIHESILSHPNWFRRNQVVIAGDFNSNKFWDGKRKSSNHSIVVESLKKRGLTSTYHAFFAEQQGEETRPTYFQYRHKDLPYHIDCVFVPEHWRSKIRGIEVGEHSLWAKLSDHMPLVVELMDGFG